MQSALGRLAANAEPALENAEQLMDEIIVAWLILDRSWELG
jgi:hypothetical protein